MVDITNDFFNGSSSKNQNRLHLGFHYCRSYKTRFECINGFNRFMDKYEKLTVKIPNNYYFIDNSSLIDYKTYCNIYDYEKIEYEKINKLDLKFKINKNKYEGVIKVKERFINFRKAKQYFKHYLQEYLITEFDDKKLVCNDSSINYDGEEFDIIFDCTYSKFDNMFYENCISLLYKYTGDDVFAITVMDGKFFSLYPYDIDNNIYTLTDVEYTPTGDINNKELIENKVKEYIPNFNKLFEYKDFFISQKAKQINATDDRSFVYKKIGKVYYFSGGKITGIFSMEDFILEYLNIF
jgi:hypothetical protein